MIKRLLLATYIGLVILLCSSTAVEAAKILPRAKKTVKTAPKKAAAGISVTPRLRKDRKAVVVYFKNLNVASSLSYTLSYKSAGEPRGVVGTIDTAGKFSLSREFLFGTCSAGVCRIDPKITGVVLEITAKLKNGKTQTKRFKIKV